MTQESTNNRAAWELALNEYVRQTEPDSVARSEAWKAAIGLQAVDGLQVSRYLLETAGEHIEGKISIDQVQERITSYYKTRADRLGEETGDEEADTVSARITALLNEDSFTFSPLELKRIHGRLFRDVVDGAGEYRTYDISKKEWVLDGRSVLYSSCQSIAPTLEYDFAQERAFDYKGISGEAFTRHFSAFIAGIWQIHPFCEGNTRTTAVFAIKYLKSLGFVVNNDAFKANSWYFRNALVRANYFDLTHGVTETREFLERFFENALFGAQHELRNRYLHIDYASEAERTQSINKVESKYQIDTLDCTLEELAVLRLVQDDSRITQGQMADAIGKSIATIKRLTVSLQEKGLLTREGGKRNGKWNVLVDLEGGTK